MDISESLARALANLEKDYTDQLKELSSELLEMRKDMEFIYSEQSNKSYLSEDLKLEILSKHKDSPCSQCLNAIWYAVSKKEFGQQGVGKVVLRFKCNLIYDLDTPVVDCSKRTRS